MQITRKHGKNTNLYERTNQNRMYRNIRNQEPYGENQKQLQNPTQ